MAIGSILGMANGKAEVWGSGFVAETDRLSEAPRAVHAVRGPHSRRLLVEQGFDCPDTYGDPALLLPYLYNPKVNKQYEIGLIPHYCEKNHPWISHEAGKKGVLVIDIEGGVGSVIRAVKSCDLVLSSSLHGLICADAFGVPNAWISISNKVMGGCFKFNDYFDSLGRSSTCVEVLGYSTSLNMAKTAAKRHDLRINLRKLLIECPFLAPELLQEILLKTKCDDDISPLFERRMADPSHGYLRLFD